MARRLTLDFLKTETAAGAVLAIAALAGIIAANSPWAGSYFGALEAPLTVQLGDWTETLSGVDWVKEGLMALFFFVVGLEIKYEVVKGELSSPRRLALPVVAAIGGMLVPALLYVGVEKALGGGAGQGWPIPTATDIAFALGVLAMVGRRAPAGLRTFLLALAVADDLGAVVLIGLLFTRELNLHALAGAVAALAVLAAMSRWRRAPATLFVAVAIGLWAFTLRSGVSPSVAGVAAALTVPIRSRKPGERGVLETMQERLQPYVAYGVLPLFAFTAAGFSFDGLSWETALGAAPVAIAVALIVGKPLGVLGASALAMRLGIARRPAGVGWRELAAAALLCGVGFTMSLYLAALAFQQTGPEAGADIRLGVIVGSLVSAVGGALLLLRFGRGGGTEARGPRSRRDPAAV